jgi:protein-S-isoprenylcysteine O-methyltransferase Ste14
MTAGQIPILVVGLAVAFYWFRVMQMAIRQKRHSGRAANFVPKESTGRWNRLLWTPAIVVWVAHPLYAGLERGGAPSFFKPLVNVPIGVKWALSGVVVLCVGLTTVCWKRMGKSWRMGIDPNEKTHLVVTGPYEYVRHPIYALSLVMMLATMLALPSPAMIGCGVVHVVLLVWEARREERHLTMLHGDTYLRYCSRTGRFVPAIVRRRGATAL